MNVRELEVLYAGKQACLPHHSHGPAQRDHFLLHLVTAGHGRFFCAGQEHVITAGQGFVAWPGCLVRYEADGDDPWTYQWAGFAGTCVEALFQRCGLSGVHAVFRIEPAAELSACLERIRLSAEDGGTACREEQTGLGWLAFAALLRANTMPMEAMRVKGQETHYVETALVFIRHHYNRKLSVEEIAASMAVDRRYLTLLFGRHLGKSPKQMLTEFRMRRAVELLQNPDLCIGDVARSVGYEDPLAFSRAFRQHLGVPPSQRRGEKGNI